MNVLAFDVSKDVLEGFDGKERLPIPNQASSIDRLLKKYTAENWAVCVEPTSIYHLELAHRAFKRGFTVFLVNPRVICSFREQRSRIKSDVEDAECLHAFCTRNWQDLRAWEPLAPEIEKLRSAIKRYHKVTSTVTALSQSLGNCTLKEYKKALEALRKLQSQLLKEAVTAAKAVDENYYSRLHKATGFGDYTTCAFTYLFRGRKFENADAAKAFVGLDLVFQDSGKKKGKRRISKCGDSTLRHAATCAGRGLLNSKLGSQVRRDLEAKGRHSAERLVIAAKKQIRTAYKLSISDEHFNPEKFRWSVDTKT